MHALRLSRAGNAPEGRRFCLLFVAILAALSGCAPLTDVRIVEPSLGTRAAAVSELSAAEEIIIQAKAVEQADPKRAVGMYLAVVQLTTDELRRNSKNDLAVRDYNYALSRVFSVIGSYRLDPWTRPLSVSAPDSGSYVLTNFPVPNSGWKAQHFDFIPADELVLGGRLHLSRVMRRGIGAPLVAVEKVESTAGGKAFLLPRIYGAVTAVANFNNNRCEIQFLASTTRETVTLGGRTLPLAADFTAPLVFGLSREHPEKQATPGMLDPERFADRARLICLQPIDSEKTPVIFVHGLQSTPVTWAPMINALWADPVLRRGYQVWVFNYPSGYPVPYSALLLRRQIQALERATPGHRRIVLVGHSMGGILSRLMISDSEGDKVWRYLFGTSPAQTKISAEARSLLSGALIFKPQRDIARVIFISTPHRGSEIAQDSIGRIASSMVRKSGEFTKIGPEVLQAAVVQNDPALMKLNRMPNSIDTLSPNDPWVRAMNTLHMANGVPYHSIIGDRGRGDTPNSSDGVVPYWSSHLEGAESEKIVPAGHGANQTSQAIAEVMRILKANLTGRRGDHNTATAAHTSSNLPALSSRGSVSGETRK